MISTIVESFVSSSKFLARARKNKEWDGSATLASGVYLRKLDNKTDDLFGYDGFRDLIDYTDR